MRGKPLNSQCQAMVTSLLAYFEREKENGGPLLPLSAVTERVANALDISMSMVAKLKKKCVENTVLSSPGKSRPRRKTKTTDMDENIKSEIRQTIYNMYADKKHITLKTLNNELADKEIVHFSNSSLQRLLPDLGIKFKKDNNRRFLVEKLSISLLRTNFLRKYRENQDSSIPRPVIFLDETWIYSKGNPGKSWQDDTVKSVKRPGGYDGKRFLILHAGGKDGFVAEAAWIRASKTKLQDYHGEMNSDTFILWLKNQLLISLSEPSLIILDNALYHSVLAEKQPTSASRKEDIIEWLNQNKIPFESNLTKTELLDISKRNKKSKRYVVDQTIEEYRHEVLRTPPYQCEFNAIELVWADCKHYYNTHIGQDGNADINVLQMRKEALTQVTPERWNKYVKNQIRL